MANIKFSQLPNLATPTDATTIPVVDSGTNYIVTGANLKAYTNSGNLAVTSVSATGNITGNYVLGNGSQLTGLPATYSNANVVTLMAAFGSNTVSTTGNVTAGYVLGNGSQLTGLAATYSNANVVTLLSAFGSNTISTTGNITASNFVGLAANATYAVSAGTATTAASAASAAVALTAGTVTTNAQPNITSVGILNSLSASGNITGAYIFGNGSQLTNVTASLPSTISVTGNITGNYILGNGSQLTGVISAAFGNGTSNIQAIGGTNGNLKFWAGNTVATYDRNSFTMPELVVTSGATVNGTTRTNSLIGNVVIVNGSITVEGPPASYQGGTINISPGFNANTDGGNLNVGFTNAGFIGFPSWNVANIRSTTWGNTIINSGHAPFVSIKDSTPKNRLAYWDSTNYRWSYVSDNSAV